MVNLLNHLDNYRFISVYPSFAKGDLNFSVISEWDPFSLNLRKYIRNSRCVVDVHGVTSVKYH